MAARTAQPELRYLNAADVEAAMPALDVRLELAELTMRALDVEAELPAKIGVHPRPAGSFAHAMPAFLRGGESDGSGDGLGMKWVAGFATNNALSLPSISAIIVLNDPSTGIPIAVLDGAPITAQRTAAVSGVAIRAFRPPVTGRAPRAAIIGAGTQARSHLPVLGAVVPGVELAVFDRHPERTSALVDVARQTPGIERAEAASTVRAAVEAADLVIAVASFGPVRQVMSSDWLTTSATVVPVDYATYCSAEVAREAALFLVDDRGQFLANRDAGAFDDYPDPTMTLGEALRTNVGRPPEGRVVVTHLGVGLADVVFGRAVLERAIALDRGTVLTR